MSILKSKDTFWVRWGPALFMMVVIFTFSSIPSRELPHLGPYDLYFKKGGHLLGYALLAITYRWGLGPEQGNASRWAWLLAVLFAASDEFHQKFVPGRGSWIGDVGIDALGAFFGLLVERLRWLNLFPKL